jgi:hypothetical protein
MSVIEVYEAPGGRWGWGYREGEGWKLLRSNEDYADAASARDAAAAAYPGVPVAAISTNPAGDGDSGPARELGGLARKVAGWLTPVVVLLAWSRAKRR